jgi:hypothetical protein
VFRPLHPDLPALAAKLPSIQLFHCPLRVVSQGIGDIPDPLGLAGRLVSGNEAMSDRTQVGEVSEKVGGGCGVGQGGDEDRRAAAVRGMYLASL